MAGIIERYNLAQGVGRAFTESCSRVSVSVADQLVINNGNKRTQNEWQEEDAILMGWAAR